MISFNAHLRRAAVALVLFPLATACGDDEITGPRDPDDVEFAAELGVDLDQMVEVVNGVFYRQLVEGTGDLLATPNTEARVEYTVWLANGTQVLGPVQRTYTTGVASHPLAGIGLGIAGMRVGEVGQMVLGSDLAWGAAGIPGVPPHSVAVAEVELIEVTLTHE